MAKKTNGKTDPSKEITLSEDDFKELVKLTGDEEVALFLSEWMANGRNGRRAYMKLHPGVDKNVAAVLASRMLNKVNLLEIYELFGVGKESYFKILKNGLHATTKKPHLIDRDDKGRPVYEYVAEPDFHAIRKFHEAQGIGLGIERKKDEGGNTFNIIAIFEGINKSRKERGLPLI